jgi:hypothetical protein
LKSYEQETPEKYSSTLKTLIYPKENNTILVRIANLEDASFDGRVAETQTFDLLKFAINYYHESQL